MLSRWLQRGGIGQILAPDPSIKEEEETAERSEFVGGVWNIIAPDPNFTTKTKTDTHSDIHATPNQRTIFMSPPSSSSPIQNSTAETSNVESLVLYAAKDLASCVASPPPVWEEHKKLFNFCASTTALSEKQLRKVSRMLKKDPSLANARASKMGFITDGFTPLHAAALVGNYEVASILIDFSVENGKSKSNINIVEEKDQMNETQKEYVISLNARDVQGRTALHIASEQGHINLVKLLKSKMTERDPYGKVPLGENAPLDLAGRTPLGWAATSREAKACRNIGELRMELFSPGDKSVFGTKTPALDRTGGKSIHRTTTMPNAMDLIYGFSDMPGHRIEMEDAICHTFPILLENKNGKKPTELGFFGVFDGHGDGGMASAYVADNIVQCLTTTQVWIDCSGDVDDISTALSKACNDIDVDLKAILASGNSVRKGGTTGVMAIVTPDVVLVGNVGDSRCILVQKTVTEGGDLTKELEEKLVLDENNSNNMPQARFQSEAVREQNVETKALSDDHKPNLPNEKIRIEKAGLEVVEEVFPSENGEEMESIWKIQKGAREKIAVSRAFGDFDYKNNEDLKANEQAIVCDPEITVHKREYSRDMYLVLACDGVWDVMSNDDVGKFVAKKVEDLNQKSPLSSPSPEILPEVGDELLKHCLDLGSSDNMSVLIVALPTINEDEIRDLNQATRKLEFADV